MAIPNTTVQSNEKIKREVDTRTIQRLIDKGVAAGDLRLFRLGMPSLKIQSVTNTFEVVCAPNIDLNIDRSTLDKVSVQVDYSLEIGNGLKTIGSVSLLDLSQWQIYQIIPDFPILELRPGTSLPLTFYQLQAPEGRRSLAASLQKTGNSLTWRILSLLLE